MHLCFAQLVSGVYTNYTKDYLVSVLPIQAAVHHDKDEGTHNNPRYIIFTLADCGWVW